jgi:hypothetical protein
MEVLRYSRRSLIADYLRSGGGLAAGLGGLALAPESSVLVVVCGGLTVLFGWLALRTYRRGRTEIALLEEGIACRDFKERRIAWPDLSAFKLRFYGSRREHENKRGGFMILTLRGPDGKIEVESNLEGFPEVVRRAASAATMGGVPVDPASASYLVDLGIDPQELAEAAEAELAREA